MFKVRFSATVENRDTEDTFNGWVSPNWNRYALYTNREDVSVQEFETLAEAIEYIKTEIGEIDSTNGTTYYAADADLNYESGEHWMRAGHIEAA
ncbi:hypothetical protein SEA_ATUIN_322 [Arthrobacter phage Atuin]|nr:hypothetical protein SEA_ATUIN_121 [Arthrobacter phage Atuin]